MKQIVEHVVWAAGNVLPHQTNAAHNFGELMHDDANEIDFSGYGAMGWIVSVTVPAAEGERSIAPGIGVIRLNTERLRLGAGQQINVRSANWITCRQ